MSSSRVVVVLDVIADEIVPSLRVSKSAAIHEAPSSGSTAPAIVESLTVGERGTLPGGQTIAPVFSAAVT